MVTVDIKSANVKVDADEECKHVQALEQNLIANPATHVTQDQYANIQAAADALVDHKMGANLMAEANENAFQQR